MNVTEALAEATSKLKNHSDSPRLDAEVLLMFVMNIEKTKLLTQPKIKLTVAQLKRFRNLINRRKKHTPIPYLTGYCDFFGLRLKITPNVLVPRPFTELLVEAVLQHLKSFPASERDPAKGGDNLNPKSSTLIPKSYNLNLTISDIGIGSGAIALAVASQLPKTKIIATDISKSALKLAKQNAKSLHLLNNVKFLHGSLLKPFSQKTSPNIVIANLPYLTNKQLLEKSISREPLKALDGGQKGLFVIRQFIVQAKTFPSIHTIVLEFDPPQLSAIRKMLRRWSPTVKISTVSDGKKVRGLIAAC